MKRHAVHDSDRVVDRYFREIKKLPRVSRDEERELASRVRDGDEDAATRLVEANLSFVAKIAHEYRGMGLPLEDLLNEGNLGLIEAASRFDGERETKFISYAVWWIRKFILDALAYQTRTIRVPRGQLRRVHREIEADVDSGERLPLTPVRLDSPLPEDPTRSLADLLEDDDLDRVDEVLVDREAKRLVREAMTHLSENERFILVRRFGLDGNRTHTLQEIGDVFGVSREWIRRLENKAKRRLRCILENRTRPPEPASAEPSEAMRSA